MKNKGVLLFIILLTAGFIGVVGNLYLDTIEAPVEVELAKPEIRDIVKRPWQLEASRPVVRLR